ncbi:MAG: DJ-1/PfpI family protein [Porphyromonas sp.]|nr:DJ-1/PfpI family protein [Porphyromonas sp.]
MVQKRVWIILADGFEETEAIGTWDALRRAGMEGVELVSINDTVEVKGAHGLLLQADTTLNDLPSDLVDAVVLPGGMDGANNLYAHEGVRTLLKRHHEAGRLVAAICASPFVLARIGLLDGVRATIYPGLEKELEKAEVVAGPVVTDGNIITGRGPRYAFHYGVEIVRYLLGDNAANEVATALLLKEVL